jgi:hypothetical protein
MIALAAGIAAVLVLRAIAPRKAQLPGPEALLLEEAVITEPVAPGMEGRAELRKRGSKPLPLRVRATDSSQAFARGAMVRVIDLQDGCCIIEGSDEIHLVR